MLLVFFGGCRARLSGNGLEFALGQLSGHGEKAFLLLCEIILSLLNCAVSSVYEATATPSTIIYSPNHKYRREAQRAPRGISYHIHQS
jgi:hypothetical protein